jgi:hypothetical protein
VVQHQQAILVAGFLSVEMIKTARQLTSMEAVAVEAILLSRPFVIAKVLTKASNVNREQVLGLASNCNVSFRPQCLQYYTGN